MNHHSITQTLLNVYFQYVGKLLVIFSMPYRRSAKDISATSQASLEMTTTHKDVLSAIVSMKSFFLTSHTAMNSTLHIDQTVHFLDRLLIRFHLPETKITGYKSAVFNFDPMRSFDKLRHSWQGKKLLSMIEHTNTDKVIILDSDMYFVREPTEIIQWMKTGTQNLFMQDIGNFSVFSKGEYIHYFRMNKIPERINTGIVCIDKRTKLIDRQALQSFFTLAPKILNERLFPNYEKIFLQNNAHIIEQAAYVYLLSLLKKRTGRKQHRILNAQKYSLAANNTSDPRANPDLRAIHYAGPRNIKERIFIDYCRHARSKILSLV